jgi:benzodiazapine receptor
MASFISDKLHPQRAARRVNIAEKTNPMTKSPSRPQRALALVGFIVVTFCAALLGIFGQPGTWYDALNKPEWNPPPWIFGPVWSLLYAIMAVAAWLVWQREGWRRAMMLYFIQLALNAAWTPIFFGAHQLGWALVEIILLWIAILMTMLAFLRVSKPAGWLLAPYLAWATFAAFLNFTLWRMNPV